jgi:hypothetical protein
MRRSRTDRLKLAIRKKPLAGCSKRPRGEARELKDESGNLKAEVSFQLSYFIFPDDIGLFQQPAKESAPAGS